MCVLLLVIIKKKERPVEITAANLPISGRETSPLRNRSAGWDKDERVEKEVEREDGGVLRGKRITETVAYARIQRVGVRGNTVAMRA